MKTFKEFVNEDRIKPQQVDKLLTSAEVKFTKVRELINDFTGVRFIFDKSELKKAKAAIGDKGPIIRKYYDKWAVEVQD